MEQASVASGLDTSLYPVAVLIEELRNDDLQLRLNSIQGLGTVAVALGPERTREELLPFLQEIIDDDEVLIMLAEQLGHGIPWVGGPAHTHALLGPLEELCMVEESSVRDKATEVLKELAQQMSVEQVSRHLCAVIGRLALHDWFTSRISACNLFAAALPRVDEAQRDDLIHAYCMLSEDDTPMVRRQAALVLVGIAEILGQEYMQSKLLRVFEKLAADEQESVRIVSVGNCLAFGRMDTSAEWQGRFLPFIRACLEDKCWRVRCTVADNVGQLCEAFKAQAATGVLPLFLRLFSDQEVEVRTMAAARVAAAAAARPTGEFLEMLLPTLDRLMAPREHSQHVRASLAGSVLGLGQLCGRGPAADQVASIMLQLARDESPDVRLRLVGSIGDLPGAPSIDALSDSLLPAVRELGKDRQWRVRVAVINCMPTLAAFLGEAQFAEELGGLWSGWLSDAVFAVREAAAAGLRRLLEALGAAWCSTSFAPQLQELLAHKNYLYRVTALLCICALIEVATAPLMDDLMPLVVKSSCDPVPNVRLNAAKAIQALPRTCAAAGPDGCEEQLAACLRRLEEDEDPDVRLFAGRAAAAWA